LYKFVKPLGRLQHSDGFSVTMTAHSNRA